MNTVKNIKEARDHFAGSIDTVVAHLPGGEKVEVTNLKDAEKLYALTTDGDASKLSGEEKANLAEFEKVAGLDKEITPEPSAEELLLAEQAKLRAENQNPEPSVEEFLADQPANVEAETNRDAADESIETELDTPKKGKRKS